MRHELTALQEKNIYLMLPSVHRSSKGIEEVSLQNRQGQPERNSRIKMATPNLKPKSSFVKNMTSTCHNILMIFISSNSFKKK